MEATENSSPPRSVQSLGWAITFLMAAATGVFAHAVVYPEEAPVGAYQKYVLRVPNERGFPTSEVAITFPAGVRVISFDETPGWTLNARSPDDGATFSAATWTGTIGVGRFVELGFIGVNPPEPTVLKWDVVQTYADGLVVEWTGPIDSSTPASLTSVGVSDPGPTSSGSGTLIGGAALLIALISLGLTLRPSKATQA